jgi:hypothetical protein
MRTGNEAVGMCERCRHSRVVTTPRSTFRLCERSRNEPEYPRYPRLPVLSCAGFEPRPDGEGAPPAGPRP